MTAENQDVQTGERTRLAGFWSLFVTQFQGAFSDNALKNLVVLMMVSASISDSEKHRLGEMVGALFALPFILFSMVGGFLADRYSKRTISIGVKIFEIGIMLIALVGLASQNKLLLLACVFLMGTHSAFFGPSKYGLLPELLPEKRLSWGNGLLELGTFTSIILGTVAASFMAEHFKGNQTWSGIILIVLAVVGLATSLGITRVPAANPQNQFQPNFLVEIYRQVRGMQKDRPLFLALIGNTYFNFLGALLLMNVIFYGGEVLHVSETRIGLLNASLAMGIGIGSVAAGYLSGNKIEYGLVPLGAMGLSFAAWTLYPEGVGLTGAYIRLALLGFAGGFFIVPICALLQHRPEKGNKGAVLATANWMSFVGVFAASAAHLLLTHTLKLNPREVFLVGGVLTFFGALYAVWLLPDSLLRFLMWVLTHTLYRIRVVGRENMPNRGGALLVCNHLSMIDAILLQASIDRPVRFIMYKGIYDKPLIKPIARLAGTIPISSELRPREMIKSLQAASDAIRNGELVCIFAEGQITRIGHMLPFRRGFERIMKDVEAPIIPVTLDGVWGSIFSFASGRFFWKLPRRVPYPVTVNFGSAMPATSTPVEVRQAVQLLNADAWQQRRAQMKPLARAFIETARRHPYRFAMADSKSPKVKFGTALTRSVFLAQRLRPVWGEERMAGILLPPSVAGALVNQAAMLLGKVPVNLNYTLSQEALNSCIQQCGLKVVVTSKEFLEHFKLQLPVKVVMLEEIATNPAFGEQVKAFALAWCTPQGMLESALGCHQTKLDDLATIIFSSGSTGEPKGVMLSHYNVASNVEQLGQTFALNDQDCLLGVLPFFHSFGFTGTLCLPAVLGVGTAYHANPLDAKTIGQLVHDHEVTFVLATPTFLQLYMRGCTPEQFGSVQVVMVSAEKLPDRLAQAFEEQFGIRPVEGYGCTECSPGVTVNTRDFRAAGFRQVGAKRGRIGHPLPGISVRIVDAETRAPVPVGQSGLLLVRGPNVMQGYLGRPEKTAEVIVDGWYTTGDIAALDEDGFLQITDRLSRFSKIGGEMVPHIKVEEKLHELAGLTEQSFAVTGIPDEKKGERLMVLHKLKDDALKAVLEKLALADLPNLWKPRADQFLLVEGLPYLGTGKLDLRKLREVALARSVVS